MVNFQSHTGIFKHLFAAQIFFFNGNFKGLMEIAYRAVNDVVNYSK